MHRKTCICLMGPTASGKTDLALDLAQALQGEIISVDSALVYRFMDIGTAKPSKQLREQIPHALIDIIEPWQVYSAGQFVEDAQRCIEEISARGKTPLLVGGTMMYFHALQQGIARLPESDPQVRSNIELQAAAEGWPALHALLKTLDPVAAQTIRPTDPQRISRALEVYYLSGRPLSVWHAEQSRAPSPYVWHNVVLYPQQRAWLHERIRQRLLQMMDLGFVEEVVGLLQRYPGLSAAPSMRAVGYRQVLSYVQGEVDQSTMIEQATAATRQLAKRQCTWLKSWNTHTLCDPQHLPSLQEILKQLPNINHN
jgi:tRNA dimethylallyltransferase